MDLIADIGATNSRCALLDDRGRIAGSENFENRDFTGLEGLLHTFLDHRRASDRPKQAAIAIAAPVQGDEILMTNIDWRTSQGELKRALDLRRLTVLNDFAALAHALPRLEPADRHRVGGGQAAPGAAMAVIGPGSGLGVATLAPAAETWTAVAGEGGHVTVPAMDDTEAAVIEDCRDPNGHCSAERLLSGPGLVRIYESLARRAGRASTGLTPADVTALAQRGESVAERTCAVFFGLLGTVAGNLALTVGARGGVFIAGGIVPRVLPAFERSAFRERFVAKGRYRVYLEAIPTEVITADRPAFLGLKALLGY
jgi:glucokinase